MSAVSLMNQTISLKNRSAYGAGGRRVLGTGYSVKARVQLKQKRRMLQVGTIIVSEGEAYIPASTTVDQDDQFTYLGIEYKIYSVYKVAGGNGETDHIKIEFMKAQAT
jgi:hypothetical protein